MAGLAQFRPEDDRVCPTGRVQCAQRLSLAAARTPLRAVVRFGSAEAALYVFSNARRDRIRILYWERNGLVLWSKRLEQQRFIWPRMVDGDTVSMSGIELNQLLDGFDVWAQGHRELQLKRVG
jgi:transposase